MSLIRTEAVGQAKEIMEIMKDADAVLIAGGDGTVMEAVTGFMRRFVFTFTNFGTSVRVNFY